MFFYYKLYSIILTNKKLCSTKFHQTAPKNRKDIQAVMYNFNKKHFTTSYLLTKHFVHEK